jgi:hypothetical protein
MKRFVSLQLLNPRQSVGSLRQGINPSQGSHQYRTTQTQNERRQTSMLEWDSKPRPQCLTDEDGSCPRPRGQCDRLRNFYDEINIKDEILIGWHGHKSYFVNLFSTRICGTGFTKKEIT